MFPLRQSTANQRIPLGQFVDATDGHTEEDALTINASNIALWKNGATSLVAKNSGGATHMADGIYYATLNATDTNTLGPLWIYIHMAAARPIQLRCCVYTAEYYDATFAGTDRLTVDVHADSALNIADIVGVESAEGIAAEVLAAAQLAPIHADVERVDGVEVAAENMAKAFDGTGYDFPNSSLPVVTTVQELDALTVDTFANPSAVPAATSSLKDKIGWLFALARNQLRHTASVATLYADDDATPIGTAATSDDGTTFERGKWS